MKNPINNTSFYPKITLKSHINNFSYSMITIKPVLTAGGIWGAGNIKIYKLDMLNIKNY